ncbi:MAG: transcriptional repressor, partial [Bacteroidetes bacterium]
MSQLETLLKKYNLSVTEGRKKILQLFLDANAALEHATIEQNAPSL